MTRFIVLMSILSRKSFFRVCPTSLGIEKLNRSNGTCGLVPQVHTSTMPFSLLVITYYSSALELCLPGVLILLSTSLLIPPQPGPYLQKCKSMGVSCKFVHINGK